MKVLLINPPYQTLTSNLGVGHQIPLGLLMLGGPLIDMGIEVELLDAEALHLTLPEIVTHVGSIEPNIIMTGHAGSTPAHTVCMQMLRAIRNSRESLITVYGGVYPTYHDTMILRAEPAVDIIVRGEGESTAAELVQHLLCIERDPKCLDTALSNVAGITYRSERGLVRNPERPPIRNLDDFRVGWELITNWDRYQCFGLGRSAIIQFSRGCPHRCTYCGQHGFWTSWRHRTPVTLAEEIAWLHDEHGVRFITLADENPTTNQRLWKELLEELAARNRDVQLFATLRAADIVRDAAFIDLYRRAGILYVLLGIDSTDPQLIASTRKRSTMTIDEQACLLLRNAGIRSIIAHIVGLGEDTWQSFARAFRTLSRYDGDLLNVMYATPHTWTQFASDSANRLVVQDDQRFWDYRHQILREDHLSPWQLFLAVKLLELAFHLRPSALWRLMFEGSWRMRCQRWWTQIHIAKVWVGEILEFVLKTRFTRQPKPLQHWLDQTTASATITSPRVPLHVHGRETVAASG